MGRLWNSIFEAFGGSKYVVLIDTTNGCNLKCAFCTRSNTNLVQMKTAELDCILSKVHRHTSSLQLSCAWEYSIASNAAEVIRTVGKYRLPATSIYTNGNILTDDVARALVEARIDEFVVSIGEAKKETYEKLRRGGKFEKVITNVLKLADLKRNSRCPLPLICTNLTVVNSNIGELPEFVDLAHSVGVGRIVGRHLILNEGLDMSLEAVKDKALANGVLETAEDKARALGIEFSVPRYRGEAEPRACRAPWQQLYISSNGDVSVCPRIHLYAKLGNLLHDGLPAILNGNPMKSLKRQFREGVFDNPVCPVCMAGRDTEVPIDQGF